MKEDIPWQLVYISLHFFHIAGAYILKFSVLVAVCTTQPFLMWKFNKFHNSKKKPGSRPRKASRRNGSVTANAATKEKSS